LQRNTIYRSLFYPFFAEAGELISYGVDLDSRHRRATAKSADRISHGAPAGNSRRYFDPDDLNGTAMPQKLL
jgi:hypothetical protein